MSIAQPCPYDINGEHCKYEIYYGEPIYSKCKNCSRAIFKGDRKMKDEELAEEYANEYGQDAFTQFNLSQWIEPTRRERKLAFLAGLKAGRWHDLREDPNDLPYMETELLCQKSSGRCFVGYYSCDNKFHSHETGRSYDIIRWMDIGIWWNVSKA